MSEENFDTYAEDYSRHVNSALPKGFGDVARYARIKAHHLSEKIRSVFGREGNPAILDAGCGVGLTDSFLKKDFPDITGFDVSQRSVDLARKLNPELTYAHSGDAKLPFADGQFDVVFAVCVVHHISPGLRMEFFRDMRRVLKPGGMLAVYEHNPWNPMTRRVVANVEFDRDAVLLAARECLRLAADAGFKAPECSYILFTPSVSRRWMSFERLFLSALPIGAQYQCIARR